MTAATARPTRNEAVGYVHALLMVTASTLLGLLMAPRWGNSAADLVYLPAVLAAGILAGLGPAIAAAVASALAYNYFFTAPYHTFRVHSPADIVTVAVLFLTALVTSQLAAGVRRQADLARAHAARNATIAGLARRLLSCTTTDEIGQVSVTELRHLFDCNVLLLEGQPEPHVIASNPASLRPTPSDLAAAALVLSTGEPTGRGISGAGAIDWQFRAVRSERAVLAAVGLARDDGASPVDEAHSPLLESLLDQIALALERARLEREARDFAALRERDRVRSTLLASIGGDLEPPLAEITAAATSLKRAGTSDKASLTTISSEAAKMRRYLANLLELGPASDQQPIEIGGVRIDLFHRSVSKHGKDVHLTPKEYAVLAELAKHPGRVLGHAHLLKTVWGPAQEGQTEYLRVAIRALRQKLEQRPSQPELIVNEPGVGYRLVVGIQ